MTRAATPSLARLADPFVQFGRALSAFGTGSPWPGHAIGLTQDEYAAFDGAIAQSQRHNGWFTGEEVRHAAEGLSILLDPESLAQWLARYPALEAPRAARTVGIIMAGNVPFVGFHDLLCVRVAGHRARVKTSSEDAGLTPALVALLAHFSPELAGRVELVEGRLGEVEAVIATGSNNTGRYFKHYFGKLPHVIRTGRTSVAVLDGSESAEELAALGEDVFRYFGLGCRNVGKVFIPRDFDLDRLFRAFFPWKDIIRHHKYANNYDYNRAVWLLDRAPITENGFLVMKEDRALNSPVAALYYERYHDGVELASRLAGESDRLQCIVGHGHLPFGTAQYPGPDDYADGVDTLEFLLRLDQGT